MKSFKFILLVVVLVLLNPAHALVKIDITRSNVAPLPIAIQDFHSSDASLGSDARAVVISDLESTGLFRVIDKESYIEQRSDLKTSADFVPWRQINASALVIVRMTQDAGKIIASVKVLDVFSERSIGEYTYKEPAHKWRTLAHRISDEVYSKLTGEVGYFNTRIAFVSLTDVGNQDKQRRIAVMDQDGHNVTYLTKGEHMVLTPRFSPDGKSLLFISYQGRFENVKPKMWLMNIATKDAKIVSEFNGAMAFAPRYLKDGRRALITIEKNGVSNIYVLDIQSSRTQQLTQCSSICVSASASPNEKEIVFNSDMGGTKQLYVMSMSGANVHRISFGDGYYSNPVWSPRGDLIAFTKQVPGEGFYIGVMKPDGSGERLLTQGWLVEGVSWASNGRVIIYEREHKDIGEVKLYTIDISGNNERRLETPEGASDASWSS
jgi:TolB protein